MCSHRDILLAAVAQNGLSLQYADASLLGDPAILLAAVSNRGYALQFIPPDERKEGILLAACGNDGFALQFCPEQYQYTALAAVTQNPKSRLEEERQKKDRTSSQ